MYNYNHYENKRSEKHWFRILHGLAKLLFKIEIRGEENRHLMVPVFLLAEV